MRAVWGQNDLDRAAFFPVGRRTQEAKMSRRLIAHLRRARQAAFFDRGERGIMGDAPATAPASTNRMDPI